jgi:diguanylate cyclase (GGDEF)-like protein
MNTSKNNNESHHYHEKSHALAISFSLLLLQSITAISMSFWSVSESNHDAVAINLSGRQRMLTQRIEKNVLYLIHANEKNTDADTIYKDLSDSSILFDQTLNMLGTGHFVNSEGKAFIVKSTQSPHAISLIEEAYSKWGPINVALQTILSNKTANRAVLENALTVFMRDNPQLLLIMDDLTREIENSAHSNANRLRTIESIAFALILINFGFLLFYFRRQLNLLSESKKLSMMIMENAATAIVVLNEKGDIELCNHSAEQLFKYEPGSLAGGNIKSLLEEPYFQQIGKRSNGEKFALDIHLNEMEVEGRLLFIVTLNDLTEQKIKEGQLIHLAYHDPLTGLPNRILFMDRLAQTIARAHRNNELTAVLYIDLDHFKKVNDTLGHAIGDLLLQNVAKRLMDCLREGDTIARLGGDEFSMIIDANDVNNCTIVAQKILTALNKNFILDGHVVQISGSIGTSLYPNDSSDIQALLHFADIAMYQAKAQGGNMCCKYPEHKPSQ